MEEERDILHVAISKLHNRFTWIGCTFNGESWRFYDMSRMPPYLVHESRDLHDPYSWQLMLKDLEEYNYREHKRDP